MHLSDCGFSGNLESKLTVLDIFGIEGSKLNFNPRAHIQNKSVSHSAWMKKTVVQALRTPPTHLGDSDFQTRLLREKESRAVTNEMSVSNSLGWESPPLDCFILSRKPNYPELIFNQK